MNYLRGRDASAPLSMTFFVTFTGFAFACILDSTYAAAAAGPATTCRPRYCAMLLASTICRAW